LLFWSRGAFSITPTDGFGIFAGNKLLELLLLTGGGDWVGSFEEQQLELAADFPLEGKEEEEPQHEDAVAFDNTAELLETLFSSTQE
jgi:hypothetical protein